MGRKKSTPKFRPPVIAVLGHVDHGKTTLLDKIRKTNVAAKEAAGITQHIGAYQIKLKKATSHQPPTTSKVTFIDTPGHEAFSKMRSRGAQVADLAILVIAGNDGVKPQTKEAISHIKSAGTPFLIALNKMDLTEASVDMVKAQLAKNKVLVEGYGGDIVCVEISAKTGKGIPQLLEMTLLLAEMQELKLEDKAPFEAVIIESLLDKNKGPLATLIVKKGALKIGNKIIAEKTLGKVKAIFNDRGRRVLKAGPSMPAQILGFKGIPAVGAIVKNVRGVTDKKTATQRTLKATKKTQSSLRQLADQHLSVAEVGAGCPRPKKVSESPPESAKTSAVKEENKQIKVILKADVAGTLEAIKASFTEEILVISEGVGDPTESDVLLASSTNAVIIGFNVKISIQIKKLAQMEKVKIKTYDVIYHLLEDLQGQVLKMLEPTIDEEVLGKAEVIAEFKIKGNHIAGCKVKEGAIVKKYLIHVMRGKEKIADVKIAAMQKEKQDVEEVKAGSEAGLVLKPDIDFELGDDIISYKIANN